MRGARRAVVTALAALHLVAVGAAAQEAADPAHARFTQAEEQRLLGIRHYDAARYPESKQQLEAALAAFAEIGDRPHAALARRALGSTILMMGDRKAAEAQYRHALDEFRALADRAEEARTIVALSYATDDPQIPYDALAIGRELGDRVIQARALHIIGDDRFTAGHYDGALAALRESSSLYEAEGEKRDFARVLTSLGRLHRAHGRPEEALAFYQRAFALQQEVVDEQGAIQSLNALAVTYGLLGREAESLDHYERALARARQTGSTSVLTFLLANTGGAYIAAGRVDTGVAMLREAIAMLPAAPNATYWHGNLAEALLKQGKVAEARAEAETAVALSRERGNAQHLPTALWRLARVRQRQRDIDGALGDLREALEGIESMRRTLVPTDFMKRGFGETYQALYDLTVGLLASAGRSAEAFDAAEQARARAFLDLVATRGGEAFTGAVPGVAASDPGLRNAAVTAPASTHEMIAISERLASTILTYWVSKEETIIWAISPDGIHHARSIVTAERLRELVNATRDVEGGTTRGAAQAARIAAPPPGPWRELYRLLIAPVAQYLPHAIPLRLTIVPHDALLGLSFAALQNPGGRYLVERFALHYLPAGGLLRFTAERDRSLADMPPRYLLVADPSPFPALADPLLPLPGAADEARAIARRAEPAQVVTLAGTAATEPTVRAALPGSTVVHFATHAIVRDDEPMETFLALGTVRDPGPGIRDPQVQGDSDAVLRNPDPGSRTPDPHAGSDGRLTVRELYDIHLDARLVVLSACRTAGGQVSGDGILGLSRALFFAGAPAILVTTWDVADEPTRRLMERFYARWPEQTRGEALRQAQLALIRDLRAGRITVPTPAGPAAVPEHPYFWAGFVLLGEF